MSSPTRSNSVDKKESNGLTGKKQYKTKYNDKRGRESMNFIPKG
jgi:hypothetical protein